MDRCDYCGRILHINRSDKYFLCSKKCKQKFKNNIVLSNTNKFEIVSSISRLIYFEKKLIKKEKGEINLKTNISIKKR